MTEKTIGLSEERYARRRDEEPGEIELQLVPYGHAEEMVVDDQGRLWVNYNNLEYPLWVTGEELLLEELLSAIRQMAQKIAKGDGE